MGSLSFLFSVRNVRWWGCEVRIIFGWQRGIVGLGSGKCEGRGKILVDLLSESSLGV